MTKDQDKGHNWNGTHTVTSKVLLQLSCFIVVKCVYEAASAFYVLSSSTLLRTRTKNIFSTDDGNFGITEGSMHLLRPHQWLLVLFELVLQR